MKTETKAEPRPLGKKQDRPSVIMEMDDAWDVSQPVIDTAKSVSDNSVSISNNNEPVIPTTLLKAVEMNIAGLQEHRGSKSQVLGNRRMSRLSTTGSFVKEGYSRRNSVYVEKIEKSNWQQPPPQFSTMPNYTIYSGDEDEEDEQSLAEMIRKFMKSTTLGFKDPVMEFEYYLSRKKGLLENLWLQIWIILVFCVTLFVYQICTTSINSNIEGVCFGIFIGLFALSILVIKRLNCHSFGGKLCIFVLFSSFSVIIGVRQLLKTRNDLVDYTAESALFQCLLMIATAYMIPFGYFRTMVMNFGYCIVHLGFSGASIASFQLASQTSPLEVTIISLVSVVLLMASSGYSIEKRNRIEYLKRDPIFQASSGLALSKRIHANFEKVMIDFETPLEKAINISRIMIQDPSFDKRYCKYLIAIIELLQAPDVHAPDFTSALNRKQVDQDQGAWILSNLYRLNKPTMQLLKSSGSFPSSSNPTTASNQVIGTVGNSRNMLRKSFSVAKQPEDPPPTAVEGPNAASLSNQSSKTDRDIQAAAAAAAAAQLQIPVVKTQTLLHADSSMSETNSVSNPNEDAVQNQRISTLAPMSRKVSVISKVGSADEMQNADTPVVPPPTNTGRRWSTPNAHIHKPALAIDRKMSTFSPKIQTTGRALDAANTVLTMALSEADETQTKKEAYTGYDLFDKSPNVNVAHPRRPSQPFMRSSNSSGSIRPVTVDLGMTRQHSFGAPTPVSKAIMELNTHVSVVNLLERSNHWNWDVFELNNLCQGHALVALGHYLFMQSDLYQKFQINKQLFLNFLRHVESGYRKENPYHNSMHATDVLHATHWLKDRVSPQVMPNDLEVLSLYFAAIVHDLDHPGLNNNFLIAKSDKRALLYNDRSVLENYHISSAFHLLHQPEKQCNFLTNLSKDEYKAFRELSIQLVLSTDLQAHHFTLMAQFKNKVTVTKSFDPLTNSEDRMLLWRIIIKCADVSNPTKKFHLYEKWTTRILEEFFRQGDLEKDSGIPVSPLFDRETTQVHQSQLGFIDFICIPLFETFDSFVDIKCIVNSKLKLIVALHDNKNHWTKIKEETQKPTE